MPPYGGIRGMHSRGVMKTSVKMDVDSVDQVVDVDQ